MSFLRWAQVDYDVVHHAPSETSMETAEKAHVPSGHLAKAVVLEDGHDLLLAVIPASHQVDIPELSDLLNLPVQLAGEDEFARLFADCRIGAVPPLGHAYGMRTVVDEELMECSDVYFEAGDHESLIHVGRAAFQQLMVGVPRGSFSRSALN